MPNKITASENSKILVVDDADEVLAVLNVFLNEMGHKTYTAKSGEEALKLAAEINPDLILLDIDMEGIDGYETCRRLKVNKTFKNTPVIFVTAKTGENDLAEGYAAGGVDYITKPIRLLEIEARVNTHLKLLNHLRSQQSIISALENALESHSKNITQMSHDLRSPLSVIINYNEILLETISEDEQEELHRGLVVIKRSGEYLHELINSILDLAKLDAGKMELNINQISIDDFLNDIEYTAKNLASNNNNTFHMKIDDPSLSMSTDAMRLKQVIINLISNACKFTNNGEVQLEVTTDQNQIIFTVTDNGIGMTKEQMSNIFDEYHQADASIASKYGGTGLGLSICKQLIHLMRGNIDVNSTKDTGTVFTATFPLQQ